MIRKTITKLRRVRFSTTLSTPENVIDECLKLRSSVQDLNDKFKGPLEQTSQKNTFLPFVFLLGNHSSGKSSFINYICQRKVQTAGVAPTDDSFTIIAPGPNDEDRNGLSFISDPDMGFSGLQMFGSQLKNHTQLKVRNNIAIKNFMLVDTPGMIDSPHVKDKAGNKTNAIMDRGYDFESVCRWYAERADVILLFFDPDKPGTTGETLQVLTNSLIGLDHKLYIILNKADQFKKIHDFARAYGALCWNLSKVIQRKDLPRIYTMCLPKSYQSSNAIFDMIMMGNDGDKSSFAKGLSDLEETREEVVKEVLNAPKKRLDNEINRLTDAVSLLQMHLSIVNDLVRSYQRAVLQNRISVALTMVTTIGVTGGGFILGLPVEGNMALLISGTTASGGILWWQSRSIESYANYLVSEEAMSKSYQTLFARKIIDKDEFSHSLWKRVQDHLVMRLNKSELATLDKVTNQQKAFLQNILDVDIPNLRRKSAPTFH